LTGCHPLKKSSFGGEKIPPSVAPNVWGWIDPLGLCPKSAGADKKNVFSGHGAHNPFDRHTVVPEGTSFTTWTEYGNTITDKLGNHIETGGEISFSNFGADEITGAKTYLPGAEVPNYTLYPPNGLNIKGNPTTVTSPKTLNKLLKPDMGNVKWAACQERLGVVNRVVDKIAKIFSF